MSIRDDLIDELLSGQDPSTVMRRDGLLGELKKALLNRLMAAEFDHHLDQERSGAEGQNHRNGASRKRVLTGDSSVEITIPRDRAGRFDPVLIGKYQRRLPDFDDKVISLYARGMSTREVQGHLEELYGVEVSPQLISTVSDAVAAEVAEWQSRPLDPMYPLVFCDALRVKVRDEGVVRNKAVYLALGVSADGKDVLGLWVEQTQGAKFWLRIMNELRNRGVNDILIAVTDGLKGDAAQGSFGRSPMEWRRRFPRGAQRRLPKDADADLHRAPAAHLLGVRLLAGPRRGCGSAEADLPGRHGRRRLAGVGGVRGQSLG